MLMTNRWNPPFELGVSKMQVAAIKNACFAKSDEQ